MGFQAFLKVDAVFVSFRLKFPQFSPFQATWFQIKLFGGKCKEAWDQVMFLLLRGKGLWNQLILIIFLLLDKCCVQSLALSVTKRRAKKIWRPI